MLIARTDDRSEVRRNQAEETSLTPEANLSHCKDRFAQVLISPVEIVTIPLNVYEGGSR